MKDFKNVKILNNYFESCIFFPMPTTLIGTLDENEETSFGAYSLVFPYYIGHKDFFFCPINIKKYFKYFLEVY